jgi:hypothetical protein
MVDGNQTVQRNVLSISSCLESGGRHSPKYFIYISKKGKGGSYPYNRQWRPIGI